MDPAGLLSSVTALLSTIDSIQRTYRTLPEPLGSIRSQLEALESNIEHIQEWQHYTDPQSEARALPGVHETTKTVEWSLQRLQSDLESRSTLADANSAAYNTQKDQRRGESFMLNEYGLQKHLVDVRQCISLTQFLLSICQSPFDQNTAQEVKEVVLGAKTLQHAHTSNKDERQSILSAQHIVGNQYGSADFKIFLTSVLHEEASLGQTPTSDSSPWQMPHDPASGRPPKSPSRTGGNDELFLPHNKYTSDVSPLPSPAPPPLPAKTSSRQAGPALPPKLQETSSKPDTTLQKQLSRKPVKHFSVRSRMSGYAESVLSDMTLDVSPIREKSPDQDLDRTDSPQQSRSMLDPGTGNTTALFSQASRSLNSLAENLRDVNLDDNPSESPPPYVNPRTPIFPRDIKRRDTESSLELNAENSNLISIVRGNQVDLLRALLDHGTNIDEVDPVTKRTAIIEATNLRRSRIAQILIQAGCRLHLKDNDWNTALHLAGFNGDSHTCVLLLDSGAQLNEYNREGETPLDLAARAGHTEAVICLLNNWVTQNGHAAILLKGFLEATRSGNASTAQVFIERGVQPKKLKESWKPVIYAAQSGSIPMMDLMLSEKCNIKAKCPDGWTALHYAAQAGHTAMVEKLLMWKLSWSTQTSKLGETALHIAILAGQIPTAIALIYHKNADLSMKDKDNHQVIHHAVRAGDTKLTTLLLNKGAKLDAETNYGWTPMLIAAAYGHLPLVAEFITRGVSVEDKLQEPSNKPGKKTNEAARKGYWCEIRWPHPGARAIHLALEFGNDEVVRTLIASGARIDTGDCKDWKPLHYAAWNCRPQMVELLLARGASPHVVTAEGNNPLSLGFREHGLVATMEDKQSIFEILQAAMHARRKSTLTKISQFKGIGPRKTRDVSERNKAWHTAELAAALYLAGQLEDDESDSLSQLAPSTHSRNQRESRYDEDLVTASSSRPTKRMTD